MEQILMIFALVFLAGATISAYLTSVYYKVKLEKIKRIFRRG